MPSLHVLKGANQGNTIALDGDRFVIGRNPECEVVIPVTSVSREHAQILRDRGHYYIEDLESRNKTYVNNRELPPRTRTPLRHNDHVRICDFVAVFLDGLSAGPDDADEAEEAGGNTTVEATLSHSSNLLDTQPAEKLRGLIEIGTSLRKTLELDALLPKIVENLFTLFKQADRCFIILADEVANRLMPKVVRTRRPQDEASARFSRSIVRQCLETAQAFLSDDATQDSRFQMSQSVVDFRIRSVMCVPLCNAAGKAFGVVQLDTQDRTKKFTKADLEFLWGVANQAAIALENARMYQEAVHQERIERDLQLAREVQLSFLPQRLPEVPGYEFHAHYEPAYLVGGDYYGFVALPPLHAGVPAHGHAGTPGGRLAMALGDVAGKGVSAALLMAKLSSDARYCFLAEADPARVVARLNDLMAEPCGQMDRFITLAAVLLDPDSHVATLVNAGHPSPLLYRKSADAVQECVSREVTGFALGILEGHPYESCQVVLQPGDALLLYSDGVTEAENVRGEHFTTARVHATLRGAGTGSPRALIDRLLKAVKQHSAGAVQSDDITLVALGRGE